MTDQKPDFTQGIDANALTEGVPLAGTVDGKSVILVRKDGVVRALSGECTHLSAPLENGLVAEGEIRCPWHHARFDLTTGEAVGAPAITPLSCYPVEQADGRIRVLPKPNKVPVVKPAGDGDRIVVIGGGAAGHALAEMMGRHGQGARVTLLTADEAPYDRTMCSKQYLAGKKPRDDCFLPAPKGVDVRTGVTVSAIDPVAKEVTTAAGDRIAYGRLVLATGAQATQPDFAGVTNVYLLRDLADADALIAAANDSKTAVVLGSGFIGLEVAAALVGQGLRVDVVTHDPVPLAKILGPEAGGFVQGLHEQNGVTFHVGRSIARYDENSVVLDDGLEITADLVVSGIGVRPRVDLASQAGLALGPSEDGVAVDAMLRTSNPDIHAIGDIARYPDPRGGEALRVEHWVHAQRQGQYLARCFMGMEHGPFADTPFFWSGHYGTQLRYVGHGSAEQRTIEGDVDGGEFAIHYEGNRALLTCQRDIPSLQAEAEWDAEGRKLAVT
ncbi:FAD-dependent oxidoreductase [Falsirhodobacter sp. alg1]|uniref:FAD-dependent oxidoreductase n=1 Tax=Falsirhodobacter sp. alg1 TaxID=1472418 RepID=UPI0005F0C06E|nr:FAD-dependent oxidoreductase [Falsirhodobacter sp. alg1]